MSAVLVVAVAAPVLAIGVIILAMLDRATRKATPPDDAVAMLARWQAEGAKARDRRLTQEIEQLLSEADRDA